MLCFSTWITLLILIGSVWSQTPDTEPSARSLKFGGALLEPARVVFCGTFCKNLGRLLFIRNIGCFVNCPELWGLPATMQPSSSMKPTSSTTASSTNSNLATTTAATMNG